VYGEGGDVLVAIVAHTTADQIGAGDFLLTGFSIGTMQFAVQAQYFMAMEFAAARLEPRQRERRRRCVAI
jgi:hypothetical protein